jgi:hypothetical protein
MISPYSPVSATLRTSWSSLHACLEEIHRALHDQKNFLQFRRFLPITTVRRTSTMEISQMAAMQVAGAMALTQQAASMGMMKKAAQAQMQMANVIAQQAAQGNKQQGFSVYA